MQRKLWSTLTGIFAFLLTIAMVVTFFGDSYATMINKVLGTASSRIVGNDGGEDTLYYKSDYLNPDGTRDDDALTAMQKALCEQIQGEGSVLLKNNGALPLAKGLGVTFFGRSSVDTIYGGTGSGQVDTANAATLLSALSDAGFKVNEAMQTFYAEKIEAMKAAETNRGTAGMWTEAQDVGSVTRLAEVPVGEIKEAGISYDGYKDLAIVTFGRSGGEGSDLAAGPFTDGENYFELQASERELLTYVKEQGFENVVVLLNSSNAMATDWVEDERYGVDAVLWIGGPGQYGLNAVAQILTGEINPSGKLVDTYSASSLSSPAMRNFGGYTYANADTETGTVGGVTIDGVPGDKTAVRYAIHYLVEQEGIYVGYKYYETRYEDIVLGQGNANGDAGIYASTGSSWNYAEEVNYPFGFGLSYTTFRQTLDQVSYDPASDQFTVMATVTNTGSTAGKDVVQVYGQQPYTDFDRENGIEKAAVQLIGFGKTKILAPGASETVTVTVDRKELTSYDARVNKSYILENGTYYLAIGSDAHHAVNNILALKGRTMEDGMDQDGDASLVYEYEVSADGHDYTVSATGYKVTNQFDNADLNSYEEGLVTYLSRQDWQGTYPVSYDALTATDAMIHDLQFNYEPDAPADITAGTAKSNYTIASMKDASYEDAQWEALLDQMTLTDMAEIVGHSGYGTQAVINVGMDATVTANGPQGISGTHEGEGTVAYTSEPIMAATFNKDLMRQLGLSMGEDALRADTKIVGWYGPAMNIHRTPYSGRNFEYYSEDSYLSGIMAYIETEAAQEKGIVAYIKHFALNDQETYRQSVATFANEQAIREIYLKPFQYTVEDGGAKAVMSSFNRIGFRWAGAHYGLLTEVLRNEWGFKGSVLTDAVMANRNWMDVRIGVEAGNDNWLSSGDWLVNQIVDWAKADGKFYRNIRESAKRFLYTYADSSAINGMSVNARIETITPYWQTAIYATDIALAVLCFACLVLTLVSVMKTNRKKGN